MQVFYNMSWFVLYMITLASTVKVEEGPIGDMIAKVRERLLRKHGDA